MHQPMRKHGLLRRFAPWRKRFAFVAGNDGVDPMNVPRNVLWFEALLYMSLTLDAVSVAFQDRTPKADMTAQMINVATVMAAGLILLMVISSGSRPNAARAGRALRSRRPWCCR